MCFCASASISKTVCPQLEGISSFYRRQHHFRARRRSLASTSFVNLRMANSQAVLVALLCSTLAASATAEPRVVPMKFSRSLSENLAKRDTAAAPLANLDASYLINGSIGTPPQTVAFALDTGSSDTWMIAANACPQDLDCTGATCKSGTESPKIGTRS